MKMYFIECVKFEDKVLVKTCENVKFFGLEDCQNKFWINRKIRSNIERLCVKFMNSQLDGAHTAGSSPLFLFFLVLSGSVESGDIIMAKLHKKL